MIPGLNKEESIELGALLEEAGMGDFERRRRHMKMARQVLARAGLGFAEALNRQRHKEELPDKKLAEAEF